jgi:hypothetical protein
LAPEIRGLSWIVGSKRVLTGRDKQRLTEKSNYENISAGHSR